MCVWVGRYGYIAAGKTRAGRASGSCEGFLARTLKAAISGETWYNIYVYIMRERRELAREFARCVLLGL